MTRTAQKMETERGCEVKKTGLMSRNEKGWAVIWNRQMNRRKNKKSMRSM